MCSWATNQLPESVIQLIGYLDDPYYIYIDRNR